MKNNKTASLSLRKLLLSAFVAAPLATLPSSLWALPANQAALDALVTPSSGVTVTSTNAARIDVTATQTNSYVKWTEFGSGANTINAGDTIQFTLPSSSSSILNMVTGTTSVPAVMSSIGGTLSSNGNIFIMNPAGITITGTGVITANGIGLSTVPETEYYFMNFGQLQYIPNQSQTAQTTAGVTVSAGASLVAASGTGNIWINAQNVGLAGSLNAGNVSVTAHNDGNVILGDSGTLTVGSTSSASAATLSVTANSGSTTPAMSGTITIGNNNVTVYGPTVNLTTGNASITQAGGNLFAIGSNGAGNSTLNVNSGSGNIDLVTWGVVNTSGSTLTVNATGNNVSVVAPTGKLAIGGTIAGNLAATATASDLILNTATVGGALNAGTGTGNIVAGGNVTVTGAVTLDGAAAKNLAFTGSGGSLVFEPTDTVKDVTINWTGALALGALSASGNLVVTNSGNLTQSAVQAVAGNVTLESTGGDLTISQNFTGADKVTLKATKSDKSVTTTVALNPSVELVVNAGKNITLADVTSPKLTGTAGSDITLGGAVVASTSVTLDAGNALAFNGAVTTPTLSATGKTIVDGAGGALTVSGTTTLTGNTSITLDNGVNDYNILVVKAAPSGALVADANGIVLGNGTAAAGNVSILAGANGGVSNIAIGAAAGDTISVAGDLTLDNDQTANGNITDATNNLTVTGNVTLITAGTGTVTVDGATGNGLNLNHNLGQVNITTGGGTARIYEKTALNLGAVNLAGGDLTAYSAAGIVNTGRLQVNNVLVGAGTAAAPGDIALNYTHATNPGNSITGTVMLMDELELLTPGTPTVGNYLANNVSITAATAGAMLFNIDANVYGNGITGAVTLTTTGAQALNAGALRTTGAVELVSATGAITATNAANTFSTVNVTTGGAATVSSSRDLMVTATVSGAGAVAFTSAGNLTVGNYVSRTTGGTTFTATGSVTDSVNGLSITGDTGFSGASILIDGTGHSFGGVTLTTTGNGNATIIESGTLRIVGATMGTGNLTAQSLNGNVIDSGNITAGNATFTANVGLVELDVAHTLGGRVNISSAGNTTFTETNATTLGNVSSGGFLTVTSGGAITQASGAAVNAFGNTTFSTGVTNTAITLGNSGNSFGGLFLNSGTAATTVVESGTVNLVGVTAGTLTVTSGGDIIDTTAAGNPINVSGVASFTAANGSITLDKANGNYATVKFTTGGAVTLVDTGGNLQFDTSTIGGTLTVTNSTGSLTQAGSLKVTGDVTLNATAAGSEIRFQNTANEFGALQFQVGTAGAVIDEMTSMNLRGGSKATGPVTLNTNGDFVTSGTGASQFTFTGAKSLTINAIGTITPGVASLDVLNGIVVSSPVKMDLGNLSLSSDLHSIAPVFLGAGTQVAPQP